MSPLEAVKAFLEAEGIGKGEEITVAFSGGYDSLCLLSVLTLLSQRCRAVYVDHNIRKREELEREIGQNRENCRRLGIPLEVVTIPSGKIEALAAKEKSTTEAAARKLRYEILSSCPLLATAHNRDDQGETLIMRMISGGTLISLAGIRRRRGNIIRPLLDVSRKEIEEYVDSLGLVPSQDSTNSSTLYFRNRVRQLVMPSLSREAKDSLVRIADNVQEIEKKLESVKICSNGVYKGFSRASFLSLKKVEQARVLYSLLEAVSSERISLALLERMTLSIEKERCLEERAFIITVSGDEVRFYPQKAWFVSPFCEGASLCFGLSLHKSREAKALRIDAARLEGKTILRISEEGDTIRSGGRVIPISSLLSASKCPYAIVLEDRREIRAVFASPFGGRDRIADSMRSTEWQTVDGFEIC